MWIVVGTKHDYVPKPRGVRVPRSCPECRRVTTFFEVVPRKYITVFWVPLIPTGKGDAVLECDGCHKHFQISPRDYVEAAARGAPADAQPASSDDDRIVVQCPKCARSARVPLTTQTLRVTCPGCREKFDV